MHIGCLTVKIHLPACASLKAKRSRLKPLLHQVRKRYNASVAETGFHDVWQTAEITIATIHMDGGGADRTLRKACSWIEARFPDLLIEDERVEIINYGS